MSEGLLWQFIINNELLAGAMYLCVLIGFIGTYAAILSFCGGRLSDLITTAHREFKWWKIRINNQREYANRKKAYLTKVTASRARLWNAYLFTDENGNEWSGTLVVITPNHGVFNIVKNNKHAMKQVQWNNVQKDCGPAVYIG